MRARGDVGDDSNLGSNLGLAVELAGHPGLVVRPPSARALYVFAHGAGAGMRHDFMAAIATALAARDVAMLRW
jgi:uncharacterized protein